MSDDLEPLEQGRTPRGQEIHDDSIGGPGSLDIAADRAWMEEARRRYEAVRSGKARTLGHDEVVAQLEARFGSGSAAMDDPGPLSDAWKAELDRREAEFQAGRAKLIDNDEVFAYLRARFHRGARTPEKTDG